MKVIAIFNQKGGVGKSTTAINLMAEYFNRGERVLGIDIDPQGHLTKFLGVDTNGKETMYELMTCANGFDEVKQETRYGDVLPCDRTFATVGVATASDPSFAFRLRSILSEHGEEYDLCIIDCPPAVNSVTVSALVAADFVLIPTEAEYFSMDGMHEISRTIAQIKGSPYLNPKLKVAGVLFTRYRGNLTLTREIGTMAEQAAQELFGSKVLETKIPLTCDIPESQAAKRSVAEYKKGGKAAIAYSAVASELAEVMK